MPPKGKKKKPSRFDKGKALPSQGISAPNEILVSDGSVAGVTINQQKASKHKLVDKGTLPAVHNTPKRDRWSLINAVNAEAASSN